MGDRVLFQVVEGQEFSPVVYCHWSGENAPQIVARLRERMKYRKGDLAYCAARLVQECCDGDEGCLSFGIWNADKMLTEEDSHGDAGVVLINANDFSTKCFGGYLKEC